MIFFLLIIPVLVWLILSLFYYFCHFGSRSFKSSILLSVSPPSGFLPGCCSSSRRHGRERDSRTGGGSRPAASSTTSCGQEGQKARGFFNNELRTEGGSRPAASSTTSCGQEGAAGPRVAQQRVADRRGQQARGLLNYQGVTVELYSAYDLSVSDWLKIWLTLYTTLKFRISPTAFKSIRVLVLSSKIMLLTEMIFRAMTIFFDVRMIILYNAICISFDALGLDECCVGGTQ